MPEIARRVNIDVSIAGHSVTDHFAPYLLEFSYTDNAHGKADEVQITLHNRDGRFTGEWKPKKGMEVKAAIVCESWEKDGEDIQLPCGSFKIDEIEFSGPPDKVKIKAVSSELNGPLRDTNRTRAWENTSLQKVASQLARENNLQLMYYGPEHSFERQDQRNESDLAFVNRLAIDRNMNCKTHDGKLILFDADEAEAADATLAIPKKGNIYSPRSYSFKVSSAGTDYKNAKTAYSDPKTGTTHTAEVKSAKTTDSIGSEKTLNIQKRVENAQQAAVLGKSELRKANAKEQTANIEIMGCPRIAAGQMIKLEDFGDFSGNYFVKTATHKLSGGYTTSLELTTPSPTTGVKAGNEVNVAALKAREEVEQDDLDRRSEIKIYPPGEYPLSYEEEASLAALCKIVEETIDLAINSPTLDYINLLHESIILCLAKIAKKESERKSSDGNARDAKGFLYLADMQRIWLSGQKHYEADTSGKAIFVSWNWLYSHERVQKSYKNFVVINDNAKYTIFNRAAKKSLYDIIFNEVKYGESEEDKLKEQQRKEIRAKILPKYIKYINADEKVFDFIHSSWLDWEYLYYAYREVEGFSFPIDGLTASFSTFTLRALASGRLTRKGEKWTIRVEKIAVFGHDKFNFAKSGELHNDFLGVWDCDNLTFSPVSLPSPSPGKWPLDNEIFRSFGNRYNVGRDFLALSQLHIVESFTGQCYEYPL